MLGDPLAVWQDGMYYVSIIPSTSTYTECSDGMIYAMLDSISAGQAEIIRKLLPSVWWPESGNKISGRFLIILLNLLGLHSNHITYSNRVLGGLQNLTNKSQGSWCGKKSTNNIASFSLFSKTKLACGRRRIEKINITKQIFS